MLRLVSLLVCLLCAGPAAALEITQRNDLAPRLAALQSLYNGNWRPGPGTFDGAKIFHLSGPIQKGDTEKVRAALETTWGKYLVIDSPGGNFLEGIALGTYIKSILENQDPDIYGLFVLKDGPCLSACALAVALSTSTRDITDGFDLRFIEHGARLGFHMGLLPEAQATQSVQAREMMNLTYDITQAYTSLIMGGVAPPILLAEALEHRSADSFFELRGGVRTHAMRLTPVGPPHMARAITDAALSMDAVEHLCFTAFVSDPTLRKSFVDYEFGLINGNLDDLALSLSEMTARLGSPRIAASHNGVAHCLVELRGDGTVGMRLSPDPLPCTPRDGAWCAAPAEDWPAVSDASVALLADAYGCPSGRMMRQGAFWANDLRGVVSTPYTVDWGLTIARDVNMRAAPGLDGGRMGGLAAGQTVTVQDCALVDGPQGVWLQVDANGKQGWISARFVDRRNLWGIRPLQDGP